MTTTARIHFVQATEPWNATREERIVHAKHSHPAASLWVPEDGYPRRARGLGVIDRLENFFSATTFEPAFGHARKLCGQFVAHIAPTVFEAYPTTPTIAAPTFWEYLVICHGGEPTVLVRRPGAFCSLDELDLLDG